MTYHDFSPFAKPGMSVTHLAMGRKFHTPAVESKEDYFDKDVQVPFPR